MPKANQDLRMAARGCGVPLWAIASKLDISEQTLIRQWRKELSDQEKDKVLAIINEVKVGATNASQ